ncbi:hypothetical protein [Mumia zhuanghuii]|uniref:Uncharacterized protein n=1 Tax=Mumia zhuanghuii TaxID=2585211 RepID=A0A5C4MFJ7_9ACTN|nr:hypothetical protein [Mumia zhuanghuii]TNC35595.1 hypothetical protein FHE65_26980 [Mumia zhuanghuii]
MVRLFEALRLLARLPRDAEQAWSLLDWREDRLARWPLLQWPRDESDLPDVGNLPLRLLEVADMLRPMAYRPKWVKKLLLQRPSYVPLLFLPEWLEPALHKLLYLAEPY